MSTTPDGIDHRPGIAADTLGHPTPTTIRRGCRAVWPCDAARDWLRRPTTPEEYLPVANAIRNKHQFSQGRTWPDWRTAGPGPIEHIREEQA